VSAEFQFTASIPRRVYEPGVSITGLSKAIGKADDGVGPDNLLPDAAEIEADIARALGPARSLREASDLRERIQSESTRKAIASAIHAEASAFLQDWIIPPGGAYRVSSSSGSRRLPIGV
jgi:hypothetical protein